ncbi:MAG: prepilin-type N-terminal cleavage/methylation domain-containing protein [Paucibacter sp.]|nr:prepilin-type N-terminal cleavage/methylation domain-containing protein [Roseateles sp.]
MPTPAPRPSHGFTLVEVLVALVVMAVMAVMAWRGVDAMVRSRDVSQSSIEATARLQTVMAQLQQDLSQLYDPQLDRLPAISFDGSTLRIVRQRSEGATLVAWSVRGGNLIRWESPLNSTSNALLNAMQLSQQALDQPSAQRLQALSGAAGWQVLLFRGSTWSNAQSSDDLMSTTINTTVSAASTAASAASGASGTSSTSVESTESTVTVTRALPTGLYIKLDFAPDSGQGGSVERKFMLGPQP